MSFVIKLDETRKFIGDFIHAKSLKEIYCFYFWSNNVD